MSCLVILQSNTGNTRTFLEFLSKNSEQDLHVCEDFNCPPLSSFESIAFGTYTWGNGKIPSEIKQFVIDHHKELKDKKVLIFGSGSTIYPRFCGAVDGLLKICSDSKANIIRTVKFEQRFDESERDETDLYYLIDSIKHWSRPSTI
ncbi:flavodoxin domain-containing protein [Priestia megaterium]|uniref:flavodoxin domain-containing protein n=1 Tax=Priestia megaterium TaxID=1404 RepID=UPI0020D22BD8|nr:flavodoxin family protein [Priestia megaterium]